MSEEAEVKEDKQEPTAAELMAEIERLKSEKEAVERTNKGLLDDKDKWRKQQQQAKEEAERIRRESEMQLMEEEKNFSGMRELLESQNAEQAAKINALISENEERMIEGLASEFSSSHAIPKPGQQRFIKQEYKKYLKVIEGQVAVLDDAGNVTGKTIDDLNTSFMSNEDYEDFLVGTKASGGGATGSVGGVSGTVDKSSMTLTEQAALANNDPVKYKQLFN